MLLRDWHRLENLYPTIDRMRKHKHARTHTTPLTVTKLTGLLIDMRTHAVYLPANERTNVQRVV